MRYKSTALELFCSATMEMRYDAVALLEYRYFSVVVVEPFGAGSTILFFLAEIKMER